MKHLSILATLLLFVTNISFSQSDSVPMFKTKFGLHGGTTSGVGLSLGTEINNQFAITATSIPLGSKEDFVVLSGLELDYKLKDNTVMDIYLSLSGSHWRTISTSTVYNDGSLYQPTGTQRKITDRFNTSVNLKFDVNEQSNPLHFQFYVGYGVYDFTNDYRFLPTTGISLYYCFAH